VEVAADLGIHVEQLYRWRRELGKNALASFPGNGKVNSEDEELHRLRRDLKRVTEERDFLKKATVFFAKESR
jgi:transposase